MRRFFLIILGILSTVGAFFLFFKVATGPVYTEYEKLWDYRRLHPEFIPDSRTIKIFSAGNTSTYADWLWISLIQYIGDNIGNGKFVNFSNPILKTITELHPHFIHPYTLSLLLAPIPNTEKESYEKDKAVTKESYAIGLQGIEKNCNAEKLSEIRKNDLGKDLWENFSLKNPCTDGMLPYYVAYSAGNLGELESAEDYYKITSMQDDGPKASRFLSTLMRAKTGDYKTAAMRFFAVASEGYDESPFICQKKSLELVEETRRISNITHKDVESIKKISDTLEGPKDLNNPLVGSTTNCFDTVNRGVKQLFLWYISDITKSRPEITDGKSLIAAGLLKEIPTIKEQKGWTVRKQKDGSWEFRKQ